MNEWLTGRTAGVYIPGLGGIYDTFYPPTIQQLKPGMADTTFNRKSIVVKYFLTIQGPWGGLECPPPLRLFTHYLKNLKTTLPDIS